MRLRIAVTLSMALLAGMACYWYQTFNMRNGGDIGWPVCAAQALLRGHDPYLCSAGTNMPTNMLPTALLLLPFVTIPAPVTAGLIIALSTGLLAWGLIRDQAYWRLICLLSFPFWQCVQVANWTILLVAVALSPWCYPLLMVKPHAALPILFARFSWRGVRWCGAILFVSLLIMPDWPLRWWASAQRYSGGPLLVQFPFAAVILLALLRWRSDSARYLLLCALAPLRSFYDYLLLFLLPQTPRQLLFLVAGSWLTYYTWFFGSAVIGPAGAAFLWMYLPCLVWVLKGSFAHPSPNFTYGGDGDGVTQFMQWRKQLRSKARAALDDH